MSWKLFLDDVRDPVKVYGSDDFKVARTADQAERLVAVWGAPSFIGFDHDLGEIKTGMSFAVWLVEKDMDEEICLPDDFSFNVHSANPVGAENIRRLMNNYLAQRKK